MSARLKVSPPTRWKKKKKKKFPDSLSLLSLTSYSYRILGSPLRLRELVLFFSFLFLLTRSCSFFLLFNSPSVEKWTVQGKRSNRKNSFRCGFHPTTRERKYSFLPRIGKKRSTAECHLTPRCFSIIDFFFDWDYFFFLL